MSDTIETAILGGGCFWCTEAVFENVKGVKQVVSGYSGGTVPGHPTYREIISGLTGHAEVVHITFDPEIISYDTILNIFMTTHDPTTLNRQGADVGTQYRSAIFYNSETQKATAEKVIKNLQPYYDQPIVTEITEAKPFYEAEIEHQDFYKNHPNYGYCTVVIDPKLKKLKSNFKTYLKP